MPIVRTGSTEFDKEEARWNRPRNVKDEDGKAGFGPIGYEEYPRMLYKAQKKENGQISVSEPPPPFHAFVDERQWDRALQHAEQFTKSCQLIVHDALQHDRAVKDGWRETQPAALEHLHGLEKDIANAAAEANFAAAKMSGKAQAERKGREEKTHEHVPT